MSSVHVKHDSNLVIERINRISIPEDYVEYSWEYWGGGWSSSSSLYAERGPASCSRVDGEEMDGWTEDDDGEYRADCPLRCDRRFSMLPIELREVVIGIALDFSLSDTGAGEVAAAGTGSTNGWT